MSLSRALVCMMLLSPLAAADEPALAIEMLRQADDGNMQIARAIADRILDLAPNPPNNPWRQLAAERLKGAEGE